MWHLKKVKVIEADGRMLVARGWGKREMLDKGYKLSAIR